MNSEQIILERDNGIGKITFNNPKRHNAMSLEMWREGATAIEELLNFKIAV